MQRQQEQQCQYKILKNEEYKGNWRRKRELHKEWGRVGAKRMGGLLRSEDNINNNEDDKDNEWMHDIVPWMDSIIYWKICMSWNQDM